MAAQETLMYQRQRSVLGIPMYQGEDFGQRLSYYTDLAMTVRMVIENVVMDVRNVKQTLFARFDDFDVPQPVPPSCLHGTIVPVDFGVIDLMMGHTDTAKIPAGKYDVDIFADVLTGMPPVSTRMAITKVGVVKLVVTARRTQDMYSPSGTAVDLLGAVGLDADGVIDSSFLVGAVLTAGGVVDSDPSP